MTRAATSALALALGLAAALALASCGGGSDAKLLPGTTAREITENLESVRELAAEGECVDAQDAALEVSTQVEDLQGIDPKLKEALQDGAARLNEVVLTCTEETTEEDTEETLPTTTETDAHQAREGKEAEEGRAEAAQGNRTRTARGRRNGPPNGEAKGHEEPPKNRHVRNRPRAGSAPAAKRAAATDGGRNALGALRARRPARVGRDVERLQGQGPRPRADRRGQGARRAPLRRRALRRTLPSRGAGRRQTDPPQHRPGLRHRRRRQPPLHRHGVRRGPLRRPGPAAAGADRPGDRGRGRRPGLRRASTTPTGGGSSTATSSRGT